MPATPVLPDQRAELDRLVLKGSRVSKGRPDRPEPQVRRARKASRVQRAIRATPVQRDRPALATRDRPVRPEPALRVPLVRPVRKVTLARRERRAHREPTGRRVLGVTLVRPGRQDAPARRAWVAIQEPPGRPGPREPPGRPG